MTYHDSDNVDEGQSNYRSDNGGVDIGTGNGGYCIGYTAAGEWLEYTVDVKEAGNYKFTAYAACGSSDGAAFSLGIVKDGNLTNLCSFPVPQTDDGSWNTYVPIAGSVDAPLEKGQQILRLTVDRPYGNIDKIVVEKISTGISQVTKDKQVGSIYNMKGQRTGMGYKGVVIVNDKKVVMK